MNKLILFRIFALFPFLGILIPDLASKLNSFSVRISTDHIIIIIALAISIILCSFGIWYREYQQLKSHDDIRFKHS